MIAITTPKGQFHVSIKKLGDNPKVKLHGKYSNEVLAKQFDPKVLARIRAIEAKGDFDNPEYIKLLTPDFYAKHILRMPPDKWPEPVNRSFGKMNQSLYVTILGPSEFGISGKVLKWDRTALAPNRT